MFDAAHLFFATLFAAGLATGAISHNRRGRRFSNFECFGLATLLALGAVAAAVRLIARVL